MPAQPRIRQSALSLIALCFCCLPPMTFAGNPLISPGDFALRHDIQLLADRGLVSGPVSTWPLAWGPVLADLDSIDSTADLSLPVIQALARVRSRAAADTGVGALQYRARLSAAENPARMRSFADTPRESGEAGAGLSWTGRRLSIQLNGQLVTSPDDGEEFRADDSLISLLLGNYSLGAGTMSRWWGPGWDGSLVLSNNARPIPAVTLDRNFTDPFRSRWLSWLGPWDLSVMFGQMESDRAVPEAQLFGMRFSFRPLPSLEIALTRTAQWCGDGRPCDFDTFLDLLAGRDNRGDAGIGSDNEPGNQLAGIDLRWSTTLFDRPIAFYGQFIGEDEAGGFPSRYLGQAGIETSGLWRDTWSYRLFAELAGTSCDFVKDDIFNCGYNHGTYRTGYRYRGRVIGHSADNDARIVSAGLIVAEPEGHSWHAIARAGELNRGGVPDVRNTLTATPQDIVTLDLYHGRRFSRGVIEIGAGVERIDDIASNHSTTDGRIFVRWQSAP